MMKHLLKTRVLSTALVILSSSFTPLTHANDMGGDHSGGDDGLSYRISAAQTLAIEALQNAHPEDWVEPREVAPAAAFYKQFNQWILKDLQKSRILIRPSEEVVARVNGKFLPRKATTGFFAGSDILISREANFNSSIAELTAIILHECGHHTGFHDENETGEVNPSETLLLNAFANGVIRSASKRSAEFRNKIEGNSKVVIVQSNPLETLDSSRRAHKTTWSTLMVLKLIQAPFPKAGTITLKEILPAHAKTSAERLMLASQLDGIFRKVRGATLEATIESPVQLIEAALSHSNENLVWFADQMDTIYRFWQE